MAHSFFKGPSMQPVHNKFHLLPAILLSFPAILWRVQCILQLFPTVYTVKLPVSDHPKCQVEDQNFSSLEYDNCRDNPFANADAMFYSCNSQFRLFWEKNPILPFETFPFLVLARNTIMLPHLIIHSSLHHSSTGCLREVKNKGQFQEYS